MAEKTLGTVVEKKSKLWVPLKDGGVHKSSDEIEHDIDITRKEMDSTLNALSEKFDPGHYIDDVKKMFRYETEEGRENLAEFGKKIVDMVSSNPLSTALIGSGLGLFMYKNTGGRRAELDRDRFEKQSEEQKPSTGEKFQKRAEETSGEIRQRMGQTEEKLEKSVQSARETLQRRARETNEEFQRRVVRARTRASETVSGARQKFIQRVHQTKERGNEAARQTGEQAGALINDVKRFAYNNPLVAGAAALAFGMLAGLLFPATETEKKTIGEKAASLEKDIIQRGKETAQKTVEQGKDVASASAQTATEKIEEKRKESEN
ncbi:MAG: DUF3618 domain-containing protein [Fibrobacter sp.]|nr:DUF3618 domain-containing protein [Fibrobacter sp.]